MNQSEVEVNTCENCGGEMTFDVKTQALKCPYCDHVCEIKVDNEVLEYDFSEVEKLEQESSWNHEVEVITCESCGAETVVEREQTATFCVYCGSSHILKSKQSAGIKPEGILPFKIDHHNAKTIMEQWFKKRWLAPNNLKLLYQSEKMQGIYVPYWTYDANTLSHYSGQGGCYYYETREVNGKTERIRKVRWYPVSGNLNRYFDDILVNGSKHFNDAVMNQIEPFNTIAALEYYSPKFLAGFMAERYSHGVKESFQQAKQKMKSQIERDARADVLVLYDTVRGLSVRTTYQDVTFKHVLLPIYHAQYDYQGKKYEFIINGETGKINGTYPYSWIKMTCLILLGITAFILFMYLMNAQ